MLKCGILNCVLIGVGFLDLVLNLVDDLFDIFMLIFLLIVIFGMNDMCFFGKIFFGM